MSEYYIFAKFAGQRRYAAVNMNDGVQVGDLKHATKHSEMSAKLHIATLRTIYKGADFYLKPVDDQAENRVRN